MAYTKYLPFQMCLAVALILGIAATFFSVSGRYDSEIVQGFEAPTVSLHVSSEKPLVIPLPHTEKEIAGIIVYAGDEASAHTTMHATIQDVYNNVLATKQRQVTRYKQSGSPEIQLFFPRKSYGEKEKVFLSLTPLIGQSLALVANNRDDEQKEPSLVFSVLYREPISVGTQQGVIVGTALALSFVLLYQLRNHRKKQWIGAMVIIFLFSILATLPYIYRPSDWGIHDWDYRHSLSYIYQTTIRIYHQIPLWNPYICGGTAGLGDPEFAIFTPSFLLQFIFGVENGTGIALSVGFIITGFGMLFLAKALKLDPLPALLSSIVVIFSTALMLKATEGHTTIIFAYMWVPWIFWAWLYAYRTNTQRWMLACGIFLSLALLQGGIYILSYTVVSLIGISLLSSRRKDAVLISLYAGIWMIGLTSFQLIPTLFFLREFPDQSFVGSAYTYMRLWDIFFGRYLQGTYVIPNQVSRWHEYGAYIGYGVFALVLIGASYFKSSKIVRILLFGMVVTLILSSLGPLFEPLLHHLHFLPRSNVSRLVLFTILCGSLVAGFGMKRLLLLTASRYPLLPLVLVGFIAIDLLSIDYPIAEQAFVIPRVSKTLPQSPRPLTYVSDAYEMRYQGNDIPRAYAAAQKGYGTFSFCSVIGPQSSVVTTSVVNPSPSYIWAEEGVSTTLVSWSPNKIVFSYDAPQTTEVFINSNSAKGWQVDRGSIVRTSSLLTVHVPAGKQTVTVQYQPKGMVVGILITFGTFALMFCNRKKLFQER
jgi:hypothetical protein